MNKTTKFAFGLLIGASVVMLSGCEKNIQKASEEMKVSQDTPQENLTSKVEENIEENVIQPQKESTSELVDLSMKDNAGEGFVEPKVAEKISTSEVVPSKGNNEAKGQTKSVKKMVKAVYPKDEKQALLRVLQKQYEQVRCSASGEKLGENSFCHQEERRLFLEIQRIKDSM